MRQRPKQLISRATGYKEGNLWLDWLIQQKVKDCVACAAARPRLFTEPVPLHPEDVWGFKYMLHLTRTSTPKHCTTLASVFPPINNETSPGPFSPRKSNYTCFNFTVSNDNSRKHVAGEIPEDWCTEVYAARGDSSREKDTLSGPWARAGLYYYCGGYRLYVRIPRGTSGCVLWCV